MNSSVNDFSDSSKSKKSGQSRSTELATNSPEMPPALDQGAIDAVAPPPPEEPPNNATAEEVTTPEVAPETSPDPMVVAGDRDVTADPDSEEAPDNWEMAVMRQHPIPPPSEPKQYRAIGLVKGRYLASEEQFTKGNLVTPDGAEINAVLLGRVMSLVKNHLNLEQDHLWVVYPRTRQKEGNLHAQIMGVWEPEQLSQEDEEAMAAGESPEVPASATDTPAEALTPNEAGAADEYPPVEDGYFSIRGEIVYQSQEEGYAIVKIKQSPRKDPDKPKFFKLKLYGTIEGKAVGHFWDFHVQRRGDDLTILQGNDMGEVQARRKPMRKGGRPGGQRPGGRRFDHYESKRIPDASSERKEALPKPTVKRNQPQQDSQASPT
ncbi:MAG TPA: hypothetical protein IGS52_16435 [Oscillatoriaceae cyanobacterium M33_DOE_052]|uniref:Uncharacterized protein n=1 Tax=Planktothricoides sp. SpSt-374 TaxID=2282167 RepID=A0A7C3VIS9_9CYAN|nr:hypothetical protein [Oscillatoriaceae cyanobacterium M33_DOE_052]